MLQSHYEETVYFLPLSPQKFLVFIWSTMKGWYTESILDPTSGFELKTPEMGIQDLKEAPKL